LALHVSRDTWPVHRLLPAIIEPTKALPYKNSIDG